MFLPSDLPLLSYNFSVVMPLLHGPCRLPEPEFVLTSCRALLCPLAHSLQQFINCGPILCLAQPEHFLHQINTSPCLSILLTKSWLHQVYLSPFPNFFGQILRPCTLSWHLQVLATPSCLPEHHSIQRFVPSLFLTMKIHFSFVFGLSFSPQIPINIQGNTITELSHRRGGGNRHILDHRQSRPRHRITVRQTTRIIPKITPGDTTTLRILP